MTYEEILPSFGNFINIPKTIIDEKLIQYDVLVWISHYMIIDIGSTKMEYCSVILTEKSP